MQKLCSEDASKEAVKSPKELTTSLLNCCFNNSNPHLGENLYDLHITVSYYIIILLITKICSYYLPV